MGWKRAVQKEMSADKLLAAIQAHGCDATDLRDAAHEAHHALFAKVKPPWERERIHQALMRRAKGRLASGQLVIYELNARAVEWIVCERFDITYDLTKWADIMWWETAKSLRICLRDIGWVAKLITQRKATAEAIAYADAVIALAGKPFRKRKKKA
jgi:hypothetical protein